MSAERVAHAAVRFRGRVFTGQSHKVAVLVAAKALDLDPSSVWAMVTPERLGFVTTRGRWLSRAVAWTLAKRCGQLGWDCSQPGIVPELHSEDCL